MELDKRLEAAIAGLLHDVGKLEQRARDDPWNPAPGIEREGQPVHATWTTYFTQHNVPKEYLAAALAGAYHHRPDQSPAEDKSLSELIALADKLSAGERADLLESDEHPPSQMVTIFDRISLGGEPKKDGWYYLPLQELALDKDAIFPGQSPLEGSRAAYEQLCEPLRQAASLPIPDGQVYVENLLGALQRSTWSVPSAYYHSIPDVSLYDHSRMTAALAVCLSEMNTDRIKELLQAVVRNFEGEADPADRELLDEPICTLVGGDISGVQDFIYTISSKGAARTLRGRSFYLQLLTEAILRYVLNKLDLPYTNVIYSGGGHFFLLAPLSTESKLSDVRQEITSILLDHHGTSLYLALGSTQVPASGFRLGNFPEYWSAMHRQVNQAKHKRYSELGDELYVRLFQPHEIGGNPDDTCSVCGEDTHQVRIWDEEREEQAVICTLCASFAEEIGKLLPGARFVALGFSTAEETNPGKSSDALKAFGMHVQFLEDAKTKVDLTGVEGVTLWALDDPIDDRWPETEQIPTARLLRYTVNRIPKGTFDELRGKVSGGFKRLGVLRMDVDDLGDIFSQGFRYKPIQEGEQRDLATLARLSTLSFQVSLFFEGWIKHLCECRPYQDVIYAVYAGGDDLFLIGPWDIMPGLAQQIIADFSAYTAQHRDIHLSGGLAFIGGKYPVYQAAEDAADALAQAKDLSGKDAFSFLGLPWKWVAFTKVNQKRERLRKLVASKEIEPESLEGPQAILQVLQQLAKDEGESAKRLAGRPVWGPWMWRGAYLLTRMAQRYEKTNQRLAQEITSIRDELNANNYRQINQWGTAARWTQLEIRKTAKDKERE